MSLRNTNGTLGELIGARSQCAHAHYLMVFSAFTALSVARLMGFFSLLIIRFLFGVGEAGAYPNAARIHSHALVPNS